MRLTFDGYNPENNKLYYWITKFGKVNYDITATINLSHLISENQDKEIAINSLLYLSQQMYVHFNEAIKLIKEFDKEMKIQAFISNEFRTNTHYQFIVDELDYSNLNSYNNRFVKKFRDNSVHYRDSDLNHFNEVISEIKNNGFVEIDQYYPEIYNIELKSQIIHLVSNVIQSEISIEEFALVMAKASNSTMHFCDEVVSNMILEISKTLEMGKII